MEFGFAVTVQFLKALHVEFCATDYETAAAFEKELQSFRRAILKTNIVPVKEVPLGMTRIIRA